MAVGENRADDCSPSGDPQELHVLAVDDSHVDRRVIERLLKKSCCKVTAVESGSRALQYLGLDEENKSVGFDSLKVNLIMTDYSMPGMTGYELLKKIKESSEFKEIPVVIMSSENVLTRIDRCLEEGAEEFLVKPVKLDDVKRLIDGKVKQSVEKQSLKRQSSSSSSSSIDHDDLSTSPPESMSLSPSPAESMSLSPSPAESMSLSSSPGESASSYPSSSIVALGLDSPSPPMSSSPTSQLSLKRQRSW